MSVLFISWYSFTPSPNKSPLYISTPHPPTHDTIHFNKPSHHHIPPQPLPLARRDFFPHLSPRFVSYSSYTFPRCTKVYKRHLYHVSHERGVGVPLGQPHPLQLRLGPHSRQDLFHLFCNHVRPRAPQPLPFHSPQFLMRILLCSIPLFPQNPPPPHLALVPQHLSHTMRVFRIPWRVPRALFPLTLNPLPTISFHLRHNAPLFFCLSYNEPRNPPLDQHSVRRRV